MTDNGPEETPLRLGVLAQTESPEIVRAALGRFRRRLMVRGLILVLVVGVAFVLYPRYFNTPKQLAQEILDARGTQTFPGPIDAGDVDVTVFKIARLSRQEGPGGSERYGIFFHAFSSALKPNEQVVVTPGAGEGVLQIQAGVGNPFISGLEVWMSVAAGTRVVDIPFSAVASNGSVLAVAHPSLGTLHLDMEELDVPDWIWR